MDAIIDNYEILPVLTDDEKKYLNYSVKYSSNHEIKTGDGSMANPYIVE